MEEKVDGLILDIQYEADKLCKYENDSYQYILELIEKSNLPKEKEEMCKKILNDEPSLFKAYTDVIVYLEENDGYNG